MPRYLVLAAALSCSLMAFHPTRSEAGGKPRAGTGMGIADPSDWEVSIIYSTGLRQGAAIRLRNGTIYPAITNVPSGRLYVDESGVLHISFRGHPKVSNGEAILTKPAQGRWEGTLRQATGDAQILMRRK